MHRLCHLAEIQGDMTTLDLAMPRKQVCFACHEKSMLLRHHSPVVKGLCVDCHNAHSSNRRMLLRETTDTRRRNSELLPSRTENATGKTAKQP